MSGLTTSTTIKQTTVLCLCFLVAAGALARASKSEEIPLRTPLSQLPFNFGEFRGQRAAELEPEILEVLGVDEYVNRVYRPEAGAALPIGLYVGYYESQRQGDSIHSPMNCLPGSGWQPVEAGRITIPVNGVPQEVNRYIVEKGGDRLLVLYWYQSHGRIVASEYWGRFYMVADAMRMNRTDAALVRVVVPIPYTERTGEGTAEQLGLAFTQALLPHLDRHLPL